MNTLDVNEKAATLWLVFLCKKCHEVVPVVKNKTTGKLSCQICQKNKIKGEVFYGTPKAIKAFKKSHKHLLK